MVNFDFAFLIAVLVGGLLAGVMYSLVAIGFVLIYKTSGVLNFAQGAMVLFAALTFVSLLERGVPFGDRRRASRSASARESASHHVVHGNPWPFLHY
jgi:branched-subunit amino acid ABC-type transport system permease component